jgi:hypothetical protein
MQTNESNECQDQRNAAQVHGIVLLLKRLWCRVVGHRETSFAGACCNHWECSRCDAKWDRVCDCVKSDARKQMDEWADDQVVSMTIKCPAWVARHIADEVVRLKGCQ